MKISIITASYNNLPGLRQAVDILANQTYQNIEHIVVDGASTDGSREYLEGLSGTDNLSWISEEDNGIYDALNKGISMASGDIVGVLHSDDYFYNDRVLEKVVEHFKNHDPEFLYGDLKYVKENSHGIMETFRYWKSGQFSREKLRKGWMPPHPTVFLKRRLCSEIGEYNTEYRIAADYDYMLRALREGELSVNYLPEVLVCMRVGGESNKSIRNVAKKSLEDLEIIKRNGIGGYSVLLRKNLSKLPQLFTQREI